MAEFSLRGVDDILRRLTSIGQDTREAMSAGAMEEAEAIAEKSRNEVVPVDSGALRDTIHVSKGQLSQGRNQLGQFTEGAAIEIVISAGGDLPYALAVHEHPSEHDHPSWQGVNVNFNPPGHGPKFIERPLNEAIQGMAERIASRVGEKLK